MVIRSFEEIIAWQKAKDLSLLVYNQLRSCRDFSFRDQLQRAAISAMNNIAEGYERNGNKEFRNFLYIAKGSCAEVRSMLYIALELNYISSQEFKKTNEVTLDVSKLLSGLIKTLK
ncbi:MAG TPA: four helix bundle protein [Patescibacteria group bacterium]